MTLYFFLNSQGDSSDGTLLNSLHQVGGETSNLISHSLGRKDSDVAQDLLVEMEIIAQLVVIFFNQDLSSLLDSLCSNSSLCLLGYF